VVLSQPRETRINYVKSRGMILGEYDHEHGELLSSGIKDKAAMRQIKSANILRELYGLGGVKNEGYELWGVTFSG